MTNNETIKETELLGKTAVFFSKPKVVALTALACTLMWGLCYPLIKIGYRDFKIADTDSASKILLAGIRFLIAGLLITVFRVVFVKNSGHNTYKGSIKSILFLCVFQTVLHYIFTYVGLANTRGSVGAVLKELSNFLIILAAPLVYKDQKTGIKELLGCVLGLGGIALMNFNKGIGGNFSLTGEGFVMLAALSISIGHLFSKKLVVGKDTIFITGSQQVLGGLVLTLAGVIAGGRLSVTTEGLVGLLVLSVVTALPYSLWMLLMKNNPVQKVAVYGIGTPIFGVITSAIILGESVLSWGNAAALLLVCAGIVIINYEKKYRVNMIDSRDIQT